MKNIIFLLGLGVMTCVLIMPAYAYAIEGPEDVDEREADKIADSRPAPAVRETGATTAVIEAAEVQTATSAQTTANSVQKMSKPLGGDNVADEVSQSAPGQ